MRSLKIDDVRTFVCVAETGSFTAAGDILGATQSAVSVRIQKLESLLGARLLARTPRRVVVTPDGEDFLLEARRLLDIHDDILGYGGGDAEPPCLTIGVSDHVAGSSLPGVFGHLKRAIPNVRLHFEVGGTESLMAAVAAGRCDAAIVRDPPSSVPSRPLFAEMLTWFAAENFPDNAPGPLPIITLSRRCRVRDESVGALDKAGVAWREVFVGGSVAAVRAAVSAGLGIACLGLQNRPEGSREVRKQLGLPPVPPTEFALVKRTMTQELGSTVDIIAEAFQHAAGAAKPAAGH